MHSLSSRAAIAALLAAAAMAAAVSAQDQTPRGSLVTSLTRMRTPVHTAAPEGSQQYGVWAAGAGYKASFHDGMTFVPYLGARYPQPVAFRWQTRSVTMGGVELKTRAKPECLTCEYRVEYDHGSVVEAYDVLVEGLEQTFVVGTRPSHGDLVLHGAINSPLYSPELPAAHRELAFTDAAGDVIVTYGRATAVDAKGRKQPMTTTFAGGEISLRLDAAWLAEASLPVIVDPMLGGGIVGTGIDQVTALDVFRDDEGSSSNVWVAYVRSVAAGDADLYVRRCDDSGANPIVAYQDLAANWSSLEPSVAYVASVDRALVAFSRDIPASNDRQVRLHWHDRADLAVGTTVLNVLAPIGAYQWRPDVGGNTNNQAGPEALVVMQREGGAVSFSNTTTSEVIGAIVDLSGTVSVGVPFTIATGTTSDFERPVVNQVETSSTGSPKWLIAYQGHVLFGVNTSWDVVLRKVSTSGSLSPALVLDGATIGRHEIAPMVAGSEGRYLVGCAASTTGQAPVTPTGVGGHQLLTSRIDWAHNDVLGSQPHPTFELQSNNDPRLDLASVSFDTGTRSHWGVLFRSNATQTIYFRTVGFRGQQLLAETVFNPATGATAAGGASFDNDQNRHVLVYGENSDVVLDRFGYTPAPAWSTSGIACSPATIVWSGSQQIGSEFPGVTVSGAQPGSLLFLLMATAPANQLLQGLPLVVPGCWLLVPNAGPDFLGVLDLRVGGGATWQFTLPEQLAGMQVYFQCFHTQDGVTEIRSTQRLSVAIVK